MTTPPNPSSRARNPAVVTTTTGAASANNHPIRPRGYPGSKARYAAPALSTANIAMIASADRDTNNPTHRPGPTPQPANTRANRSAARSTSRYVHEHPPHTNATASGVRATCSANNTGTDTGTLTAWVNAAQLPHPSNRTHSPSPNTSTDDNNRPGSTVIATNTRSNRSISASMLAASNTSVRNSTCP